MSNDDIEPERSRVQEVRKWMDNLLPAPASSKIVDLPIDDDDITTRPTSLFTAEGIGDLKLGAAGHDHDETAAVLRIKIRNYKISRKGKKIPRRIMMHVLKGKKIKEAFWKYGVQVPSSYKDATRSNNSERDQWIHEMLQEINTLTKLGAFEKGLCADTLPEGASLADVIRSMWVYDVKIDGRKRARFVARGDMETHNEDETKESKTSPVGQMKSVRVILAVAAQLNMELVTMDFPEAFLLGKMGQGKPICMFAPEGFGKPGEIWNIKLPLYGLTVSSRRFYESLSEFMRAIGFQHFSGGDPCLLRRQRPLPTGLRVHTIITTKQPSLSVLKGGPTSKAVVQTLTLGLCPDALWLPKSVRQRTPPTSTPLSWILSSTRTNQTSILHLSTPKALTQMPLTVSTPTLTMNWPSSMSMTCLVLPTSLPNSPKNL